MSRDAQSTMLHEMQRIAALRSEQRASGAPVVACGWCRGDTRFDDRLRVQSITCECCGKPMTLRRQDDGFLLIEPGLIAIGAPG